jgi:FkbM family methyltransferase
LTVGAGWPVCDASAIRVRRPFILGRLTKLAFDPFEQGLEVSEAAGARLLDDVFDKPYRVLFAVAFVELSTGGELSAPQTTPQGVRMLRDRIVHSLIGTPLQRPLESLRWLLGSWKRWKHPELHEIFFEQQRIHQLLEKTIVDQMNCIDVGCHLGSVLNEILQYSPRGEHIAVEPLAYKAELLRRKYPQVQIHQIALGDHNGSVEFFWHPRRSGFSSLKRSNGTPGLETLKVEMKPLDEIVPKKKPIGFIKLDVEGAELNVFKGAQRILAESRPIVLFECAVSSISRFEITPVEVFDFITRDLDFRLYFLKDWLGQGPPLDLPRFESAMIYPFQAFNFVAAPLKRTDRVAVT